MSDKHPSELGNILAKFTIAFTPPAIEQESTSLFRQRLSGMILRCEDIRLTRQLRSIWKKLFLSGVIVPYHITDAPPSSSADNAAPQRRQKDE